MAPQSIQLKRKRDEEALDIVYLESPRKTRQHIEVFRRVIKAQEQLANDATGVVTIPLIQTTQAGDQKRGTSVSKQAHTSSELAQISTPSPQHVRSKADGPRVFEFTRPSLKRKATADDVTGDIPLFVEKRARTTSERPKNDPTHQADGPAEKAQLNVPQGTTPIQRNKTNGTSQEGLTIDDSVPRPRKLPSNAARAGRRAVSSANGNNTGNKATQAPSIDADLLAKMQDFALQVEAETKPPTPPPAIPSDIPNPDPDAMDLDDAIYETYVRTLIPISTLDLSDPTLGILHIAEEDVSYFEQYIGDDDNISQIADDEEDENAEDWYGADYPEDELSSGDEGGEGGVVYGRFRRYGSDDEGHGDGVGEWDEEGQRYWNGEGAKEDYKVMGEYSSGDEGEGEGKKERMPWKGWS